MATGRWALVDGEWVWKGGGTPGKVTPSPTKGDKPKGDKPKSDDAKAAARAQTRAEAAAREREAAEAEARALERAKRIELRQQKKAARDINAQFQAEVEARQQGAAATDTRFRREAKDRAREAAEVARGRRRRLARLRKEGASGEAIDKAARALRKSRLESNARSAAYDDIARRAQMARTRLLQIQRANSKKTAGVGPPTYLAKPWEVLGQTAEGKKDPTLTRKSIVAEIHDIRREQGENGGLVDQARLRVLDQRVEWIVTQLVERLTPIMDQIRPLQVQAEAGDRAAIRKILAILDKPEIAAIFAAKDKWFGKGVDGVGDFHRYYDDRRVISRRYYEYWVGKTQAEAQAKWTASVAKRNTAARGAGLAARSLIAAGVIPREAEDGSPLEGVTPEEVGLDPSGKWSEAPPEEVARAFTSLVKERFASVPGVQLFSKYQAQGQQRYTDLNAYVHAAAEKEGIPFEDFELTDSAVVDRAVEAAVRQFRLDYEAKHGPVDSGVDVFGFFNVTLGSTTTKREGEAYRMEEVRFRDSLYEAYRDKQAPGMIESWLAAPIQIGLDFMTVIGAIGGAATSDLQGAGYRPQKPFFASQLAGVRSKADLEALGATPDVLRNVPDDFTLEGKSPEEVQRWADELNQYYGLGSGTTPALNLDIQAWMGGPNVIEIEGFLVSQGMDPQQFYTNGSFDPAKYNTYRDANPAFNRAYITEYPDAQGIVIPPEAQLNTPADANIVYQNAFDRAFGFGQDIGQSGLEERYSERTDFVDKLETAPPNEDPVATFWRMVGTLNESYSLVAREPGGGGVNVAEMGWMFGVDPAMLAKPARVARIVQYALATGDGWGGKTSVLVSQLFKHAFGTHIPGRAHFGIPELNGAGDTVGRWVDARKLVKDVRKAYVDGLPLSERELMQVLETYAVKSGVDPLRHAVGDGAVEWVKGFIAEVERAVGPRRQNPKQLQAAAEGYLKRVAAREGVDVITRADQARLRARNEKLAKEADAAVARAKAAAEAERTETRARAAARDASAALNSQSGSKRRSVFEAGDDFLDGADDAAHRAADDFRAPRAHRVVGGYAMRFYRKGLRKPADSASVYAIGSARHAQDIIALADAIARRYKVGLTWARSPRDLRGGKRAVVEIYGGSRETMARVADELDTLMRKHRLGERTSGSRTHRMFDPADGRVLFRDRFKKKALDEASRLGEAAGVNADRIFEKARLRRIQLKRLKALKVKEFTPRLQALMDRIKALDEQVAAGDKRATREQASLFKEAREVESQIARIEGLERDLVDQVRQSSAAARTGYGGPLGVAQAEALLGQLAGTGNWIRSQMRITARRLKADPTNAQLQSYMEWLQQAALGQRLLAEDIAGPVATARRVVAAHGEEAAFLQAPSQVAPVLPDKPPAGMTREAYGHMEIGRGVRARLSRMVRRSDGGPEAQTIHRQWKAASSAAKYNRLKLDEFGVVLEGFSEVMPALRALRVMSARTFKKDKRIQAFVKLQIKYAERGGSINWKKAAADLGIELEDEFDKLEIIARLEADEAGRVLSTSYGNFKEINELVTEALRKERGAVERPYTSKAGPRRPWEAADDAPGTTTQHVARDYSMQELVIKAQVLRGTGWTVDLYDEARGVLQEALLREKRMAALEKAATERAAVTGETFQGAMAAERKALARKLADEKLRRWAMESPYGLSEQDVWDDFVRSVEEEQLGEPAAIAASEFQIRMATTASAELAGVRLKSSTSTVAQQQVVPEKPMSRLGQGLVSPLFHGSRAKSLETFVDADGNLHLRANNYGREVWFTESADYAGEYARDEFAAPGRADPGANGLVFAIDGPELNRAATEVYRDNAAAVEGRAFAASQLAPEAEIVIPAGRWQVAQMAPEAPPLQVRNMPSAGPSEVSLRDLPKVFGDEPVLYHGTFDTDASHFIDADGNLVLRASTNGEMTPGAQHGISFSPDVEVSLGYAMHPHHNVKKRRTGGFVIAVKRSVLEEDPGRFGADGLIAWENRPQYEMFLDFRGWLKKHYYDLYEDFAGPTGEVDETGLEAMREALLDLNPTVTLKRGEYYIARVGDDIHDLAEDTYTAMNREGTGHDRLDAVLSYLDQRHQPAPPPQAPPLPPLPGRARQVTRIDGPEANVLDDDVWAGIVAPIAPSRTFAADARNFLVDMGHWTPRTADDIRQGRRVWSAEQEAEYYRANWGFVPVWADAAELARRGAFDSEWMYSALMTEMGVWDNTVDVELRLSGQDAEAQRLRVLWGDQAEGIKVLRSVQEQRQWMRERWGSTVYQEPRGSQPGSFIRVPWLMDPTTTEYRKWLSGAVQRHVEDTTMMSGPEADALAGVLQKRAAHNMRRLQDAAAQSDGVILEQELLSQSIRLTDDLLANPRYRPLFSVSQRTLLRDNPAHALLFGFGYIQRLNTITQMAFGLVNRFEVSNIGLKNWLARLYVNRLGGVGYSQVPDFVHKLFPNIESTGLGAGTTIWDRVGSGNFGRAMEGLDRLKAPTRTLADVKDLALGGLKSVPEYGLIISANAEQTLKLAMFKRLYTDRLAQLLKDGYSEVQADALARAVVVKLVNDFFPSMEGRSWWFKALNEVVPFLHYNWATTTLYAREILAHPWIMVRMEQLGAELSRTNRERWELEHPGLPYPRGAPDHQLNVTVGDRTFTFDFLGISDVARGSRLLARMNDGEEMTVYEFLRQFIRIPHPWQVNVINYLMDQPSWYTGRKVELGEIIWPVGVIDWYHSAMEDGTISDAEWFRLMSRMAFFSESRSLNVLQATEQAYFALKTDDARRKFLLAHPELREYWASKDPSTVKLILQNHGILPKSYWQDLSAEVAKATQQALDLYAKERDDWNQKLQSYLDAGGSPLDDAYKALKDERFEALTDMREKNIYLFNYNMHYNDPLDWGAALEEDYRDSLYATFAGFDDWMPKREDYKSDLAFQKALRDFYAVKERWLDAHPELFETLGRERTALELAVADHYERLGAIYQEIGERNLAIAKAEAKGKDKLVEALYGINELQYSQADDPSVVFIDREPPLAVRQALDLGTEPRDVERALIGPDASAMVVVIPGATAQKYRNASPDEQAAMRKDFWYRGAIEKIWDTSKDGKDWLANLDARPKVKAEYLARLKESDPAAYRNFLDREYYHDKLGRLMDRIEATGNWDLWWEALKGDKRFREYYMKTHPEKFTGGRGDSNMKLFRRLGGVVAKAERTGDWSVFWQALKKDKALREWFLDLEPGARQRWIGEAQYLGQVAPVLQRAIRSGDWSEWNKLLRTDEKVREAFFERNPEQRQSWLRDEAYRAATARYASVSQKNPEKAADYFASLPTWVQKRYFAQNPKGRASAADNVYIRSMRTWGGLFDSKGGSAAMAYFNSLPSWIRERYFASHPGQREKFAANDAYGRAMRGWIRYFDKEDYEGAEKYFNALPLWMRQRYFGNNPDKSPGPGFTYPKPDFVMDEKFGPLLGKYFLGTPSEKAALLRNNPAFKRYLAERGGGAARRAAMIMAAYQALPPDPWLRRIFQERYPEVFSEEAKGIARNRSLKAKLRASPGIRPAYEQALEELTKTYFKSIPGYGVLPKPMEVTRLNEELKAKKRRREALRHRGVAEWDLFGEIPKEIPGLLNVQRGIA